MKTLTVRAAANQASLTLRIEEHDYKAITPTETYEKDAENLFEVYNRLPLGAINRFMVKVIDNEIREYEQLNSDYGRKAVAAFKVVREYYLDRTDCKVAD